jgi:exopolysaccharide production protein ExoQ
MPPIVALYLWLALLVVLLVFDPAREPKTSAALWVPVIWMFIAASRLPSQWMGVQVGSEAVAFEEGNPLDRAIFTLLILLAIGVLLSRSFNWPDFFARNLALTAFLLFALLTVMFSDFAFVALKRWFRDFGSYLMFLLVLTDPQPLEAFRTLWRRLFFLVLPLSVVLIKYFPGIGMGFDPWSGVAIYTGVTTTKNMLGVACMVSGLFFFWDTLTRWPERKESRTKRVLLVNAAFVLMTLWLLHLASSATSGVCLVIGCLVILAVCNKWSRRHPGFVKVTIPAMFLLYLILSLGFNMSGDLAAGIGRDPTLTGRTEIWKAVLSLHTNPLVGTGYQSFWLGPRLQEVWSLTGTQVNEAHDGYIEVYLNLGIIGLTLLIGFLLATYQNVWRGMRSSSRLAPIGVALWAILLFYNVTEAAFGGGLIWSMLLSGALSMPRRVKEPIPSMPTIRKAGSSARFTVAPERMARTRR